MRPILFLLLCLTMPVCLPAADLPPALQNVVQQGAKVIRSFPAPDGLTGWVIEIQGRDVIAFTTASGDYLLSGVLLDGEGTDLTRKYTDQYIPQPDAQRQAGVLAADQMLVDEGSARAPLIYVYADPNCIYCNRLWTELRPYVDGGKLHVRWVLVDFLKPTSKGRAAAILTAAVRSAALAQDEMRFDRAHEEGGISELRPVPLDIEAALKLHDAELAATGNVGTPILLIHSGGNWSFSYGLPRDLPKLIAGLSYVP